MQNVFVINGHEPYPFSEGRLNATLTDRATTWLTDHGYAVRTTAMTDTPHDQDWDVDQEIEKHQWADAVLLQTPVKWMGVTWSFKRYMDQVYSAGMDGRLCAGDGRTRSDATKHYGCGGTLNGKRYMLSLTFNAPKESFDDEGQFLFQGSSVDDLWIPMHMNFRFFGMESLPTFVCYDVMKNPQIEDDFHRFDQHLRTHFPARTAAS